MPPARCAIALHTIGARSQLYQMKPECDRKKDLVGVLAIALSQSSSPKSSSKIASMSRAP